MSNTPTPTQGRPQWIRGTVVKDKMNKTRVIELQRSIKHSLYHKQLRRKVKVFIHDEKNASKVGDVILAMSTRPISKHKNFCLKKILESRVVAHDSV